MKKINNILLMWVSSLVLACGFTSCEDYLDKAPTSASDIEADDVFSTYESISLFLDGGYRYLSNDLEYSSLGNQYSWMGGASDEAACVYDSFSMGNIHSGNWSAANISGYELSDVGTATSTSASASGTVIFRSYRTIRICNSVIQNYGVAKMSQEEQNKLLGQAYMLRAWSYFQLLRRYGGMPDLTIAHDDIMEYDQPRLTYHESNEILIRDLNSAIDLLPEEWDDANVGRATKVAAMAVKSLALLYDASPLMQNGLDATVDQVHSKERSLVAAQYTQEVIDYLNAKPNFGRLSCTDGAVIGNNGNGNYKNIFIWSSDHYSEENGGNGQYFKPEEALWYNRDIASSVATTWKIFFHPRPWAQISGEGGGNWVYSYYAPTQNMVDLYEKKGKNGNYYPITHADSGYQDLYQGNGTIKDMYVGRDPRLMYNIMVPGQIRSYHYTTFVPIENSFYYYEDESGDTVGGDMTTCASVQTYTSKREESGYVMNKFISESYSAHGVPFQSTSGYTLERAITVYIRVAHLYLNYAEAAYEATGSYNAIPEGCTMTAEEALNVTRRRAGITDWVSGSEDFQAAYQRERSVELMFENSRWFDIRRWMIAEKLFADQYPIYGVYAVRNGYASSKIATEGNNDEWYSDTHSLSDPDYYAYDAYGGRVKGSSLGNVEGFDNLPHEENVFLCTPKVLTPENRVFTKRNYWYPFSTYDVNALKNLKQNPGW